MADRKPRGAGGPVSWVEPLRWIFLLIAVGVLVAFLTAQQQSADVTYGQGPARENPVEEGSGGELSGATVPSVQQMTAALRRSPVLRLPGSIATWDERRVRAAAGGQRVRIIVAPPGLPEAARNRVANVNDVPIRVLGTAVAGGMISAEASGTDGWIRQFGTADVTDQILALLANERDKPAPDDSPAPRRAPSSAELARVSAALRADGSYVAPGATLREIPDGRQAFGDREPLYVVLPRQPAGRPLVQFGPSLAREFPNRPILAMYGSWIEYHGPSAPDFTEVVTASFYGQFADRVATYAYPQRNVLGAYLDRITEIRYAGLFDRPKPYTPLDPLRVALPALPWIFAACAVGFLVLSVRSLRQPARRGPRAAGSVPARLAGLTSLTIELSGLATDGPAAASFTRATTQLDAVRERLTEELPDKHLHRLLDTAESELDAAARQSGWPDYRPRSYLQWRLG